MVFCYMYAFRFVRRGGLARISCGESDGGFTGGNMDRPALQRLMADVEAGRIDCAVVYKVERLSRSLLDLEAAAGEGADLS